jgi:membrane protein YdbS with pleckstrin-like domain
MKTQCISFEGKQVWKYEAITGFVGAFVIGLLMYGVGVCVTIPLFLIYIFTLSRRRIDNTTYFISDNRVSAQQTYPDKRNLILKIVRIFEQDKIDSIALDRIERFEIKQNFLQRRFGISDLIIHTASSSITLQGLTTAQQTMDDIQGRRDAGGTSNG